jgi:hypothetical protein
MHTESRFATKPHLNSGLPYLESSLKIQLVAYATEQGGWNLLLQGTSILVGCTLCERRAPPTADSSSDMDSSSDKINSYNTSQASVSITIMSSNYSAVENEIQKVKLAFDNGKFLSIATAVSKFNVPYYYLTQAIHNSNSRSTRPSTNRLLTEKEEKGLIIWLK